MRLTNRPRIHSEKLPISPQKLTNTEPKRAISTWVWITFVISGLILLVSLYVNSWTSTGPTFFPVETSQPGPNIALNPFARFSELEPEAFVGSRRVPEFLQPPSDPWELMKPAAAMVLLCVLLRFIPSTNWTRLPVKLLLVGLMTRYMVWRIFGETMNFTTPLSIFLSVWLLSAEIYSFVSSVFSALQSIWSSKAARSRQADRYEQQIRSGEYLPSVDILVPTYNEQAFIIRRTVMGAQAVDYPNKRVYICDDARRQGIRELAAELGCGYITQPEGFFNPHAKAGNLNNALKHLTGELIMIVDADFVPFQHFLMRVAGFFQDPKVALVQTPQDFYNPDYHVRNLGIAHTMPNDLQYFFHHHQSMMDAGKSSICCGTSYVIRRSALNEAGGFYTGCIPEDSSTSMILMTRGYETVYLNEKLSMGESPRTYRDFLNQRLRWLQGNIQIFLRVRDIPLWTTLNWIQKSFLFEMMIGVYQPIVRFTYLVVPLLCLYLGVSGYFASFPEVVYFTFPSLILSIGTVGWASNYHVSHFYNELYDFVMCFPSITRIIQTLSNPFKGSFKVTAKGVTNQSKNYNFQLTWSLFVAMMLHILILGIQLTGQEMSLWDALDPEQFGLIYGWMVYNVIWMAIALLAAIDQPERRAIDRFPLQVACRLSWGDSTVWGFTQDVSETGARLSLMTEQAIPDGCEGTLELLDEGCVVAVQVMRSSPQESIVQVALKFSDLSVDQHRQLSHLLYGTLTWWKRSRRLGVIDSLGLFLGSFFQLRSLRSWYHSGDRG